ncbi:VOC family protein [Kribbella turkmenica]|uniref:VOC family protein n=1 Tax=Kribbella turkmenica TaxID=2530375 RepID=A0A4R4W722_9ACTN|nr:VOC family protein [Kribbella turkmenica]TDD14432.1 VOC family protein [Kribbella turkmenica]
MALDLFAELSVSDYPGVLAWYEQLLGGPPVMYPNDIEAVFELAEHQYLVVEHRPDHAGHGQVTIFGDDFDERIEAITARGLEPAERETYENGVRKVIYRDPDGNEIGFGGGPVE